MRSAAGRNLNNNAEPRVSSTSIEGPLLRLNQVEKHYGAVRVLRGISLELAASSIGVLVGPNGSGKSTLLRMIAGVSKPSRGSIALMGTIKRREMRRQAGYVGHESFLYPNLSARENLTLAAKLHGVMDASVRVTELLEGYGLDAYGEHPVAQYSRGMMQRLAFVRTLVHRPSLLLLDEVFSGLDPKAAQQMESWLCEERKQGKGILWVSHDLERASQLADQVYFLVDGQIRHQSHGAELTPARLQQTYQDVCAQ